jgi:hypothetical protein
MTVKDLPYNITRIWDSNPTMNMLDFRLRTFIWDSSSSYVCRSMKIPISKGIGFKLREYKF